MMQGMHDQYINQAKAWLKGETPNVISMGAGMLFFADVIGKSVARLDALERSERERTAERPVEPIVISEIMWNSALASDQQARTIITILSQHIDVLYARLAELERRT
jgi:hypothetical protein